ncbi:MAG: YceI family protein [Planctomycetes bacterium]|nr:YceI family protein [Planctomycetota bacterium]
MKTAFLIPIVTLAGLALAVPTLTAARTPSAPVTPAKAVTYHVDPVHSAILFSTMHMNTARAYGRFNEFSGQFTLDTEKPEASKVAIAIKMESVDTANTGRDDHLRGPDFFDVKEFPSATFTSTKVERKGDKAWHVTGTLNLHGVKKEVVIPMEQTGEGKGRNGEVLIGFHGTFAIQRSDFGIKYGLGMLGDEVTLILSVEAAAK